MTEWHDIQTAPKDGANFQAWVIPENNKFFPRGFWEPYCRFNEYGNFEIWGRLDYDQEGWEIYSHLTPTHWMPQPDAP